MTDLPKPPQTPPSQSAGTTPPIVRAPAWPDEVVPSPPVEDLAAPSGRVSTAITDRSVPAAIVGALIGAMLGTAGTLVAVRSEDATVAAPAAQGPASVPAPVVEIAGGDEIGVVTAVAEAVTPSVVRIDVVVAGSPEPAGLGSGVIYRSDGYILTNNHVVQGANALNVRLASGETLEGEVVGTDPTNDLAVVRVDRQGLPAVNIRTTAVRVGEQAIAIGSPFGLDASVTAGVVSALNRNLQDEQLLIANVLQTDAAINPGNSGGALVDSQGRLIGINTAILSGSGGSQGVGFAINSLIAVDVADELIENGFVRHAFLGITGITLTEATADRLGVDADGGAVIDTVDPGSAAGDAGLRSEDIIVAIDGDPIDSMDELVLAIRLRDPGDEVVLTVIRGGARRQIEVVLGERPR